MRALSILKLMPQKDFLGFCTLCPVMQVDEDHLELQRPTVPQLPKADRWVHTTHVQAVHVRVARNLLQENMGRSPITFGAVWGKRHPPISKLELKQMFIFPVKADQK